jgi:F-type H+-transporting ATPase subunit a
MFAPAFTWLAMKISLKNSYKHLFAALFLAFAISVNVFANEDAHGAEAAHNEHAESEKFDAGKMIMEHILDAHGWHLWGEHHNAVAIPLPIILYTDKGLDVFMSSAFHHGEATVAGKYNYKLEHGHIIAVSETGQADKEATAKIKDFSVTKNVAAMFISIILLLTIFLPVAKKYQANPNQAPSGMQSLLEPIILFIRDNVAIPNIGKKKYEKYMPFLLTVFFFILINNLMGLVPFFPGGANLTGNISVTFTLAAIVLIIVIVTSNKHYWHHILAMPGVPKPILIILTPIEILGFVIRPFVLMMRLFANITAGHIVILSFISLIFIFGSLSATAGYGISIFSMFLVVFMSVLELLVAFLQAYVFTLLSAIYFGSAIEEGHHGEEHH